MVDYKKQGKRNKAMGADFERRTRKDMEEKGWIVAKWSNNVEFIPTHWQNLITKEVKEIPNEIKDFKKIVEFLPNSQQKEVRLISKNKGKCIPAKPGRFRMMQTGFPDFIAYRLIEGCYVNEMIDDKFPQCIPAYEIQFIECKVNGTLSKIEKEKAQWYLKNNYCNKFLIAYKTKEKNKVKVNYKEVKIE